MKTRLGAIVLTVAVAVFPAHAQRPANTQDVTVESRTVPWMLFRIVPCMILAVVPDCSNQFRFGSALSN